MNNKPPITESVLPGKTIGILGGGQLGRMIALEGRKLGYKFATLDPTPNSPAAQVADIEIVGAYTDAVKAEQLAKVSDVITYEFENVDVLVAKTLETNSSVPQGSRLLEITRNRMKEKTTLEQLGVPVAPFRGVSTGEDFKEAVQALRIPCVLKTTTGGYDGKGQWTIRTEADVETVLARVFAVPHEPQDGTSPFVLEAFVPFVSEVSVVVARNPAGVVKSFPVAENIHVNHILHQSIVPARLPADVQGEACSIAERIADKLQVVGLVAVEMFVNQDHSLFVNELAPRPHNSGHYTSDACLTSQFEQHVRAVCNLPLGDTRLLSPVVMVNILGQHLPSVMAKVTSLPSNMKLHLYGKVESKVDRKMGHINVVGPNVEELLKQIDELEIW